MLLCKVDLPLFAPRVKVAWIASPLPRRTKRHCQLISASAMPTCQSTAPMEEKAGWTNPMLLSCVANLRSRSYPESSHAAVDTSKVVCSLTPFDDDDDVVVVIVVVVQSHSWTAGFSRICYQGYSGLAPGERSTYTKRATEFGSFTESLRIVIVY